MAEFTDVKEQHKEFFLVWSQFMSRDENRQIQTVETAKVACTTFVKEFYELPVDRMVWVMFFHNLWQFAFIGRDHVCRCLHALDMLRRGYAVS